MLRFIVLPIFAVFLVLVQANPTGRILSGNDAKFEQFPHQVSVRFQHRHTCGGSIISNRTILTAAHCVVNSTGGVIPAEFFSIRAGTINRIAGGVLVEVNSIKVHNKTDVALLELKENLTFSRNIQAIEMFDGKVPEKADVIISGWGLIAAGGADGPIYLQYLHLTTLSPVKCKALIDPESMLCLSHKKGHGACNGDSGGPATYNGKLAGVANFVVVKCGTYLPDGYASVAYNIDWIRKNML